MDKGERERERKGKGKNANMREEERRRESCLGKAGEWKGSINVAKRCQMCREEWSKMSNHHHQEKCLFPPS